MLRLKAVNDEVLYADEEIVAVGGEDVAALRRRLQTAPRGRVRICAHPGVESRLHEMFIVLRRGCYIRPHKHIDKAESLLVVEGRADVVLFDDDGAIRRVLPVGDYASGRLFYYRIDRPCYHTVYARSESLVFHEATEGPLDRSQTVFAPWSPDEQDAAASREYWARLGQQLDAWEG